MSPPAVELAGVSVRLGGSRVLEGVDLEVPAGRFVGLVGPNGAGKTTLLRTVNGRIEPSAGTVRVGGEHIGGLSAKAIGRRVATVPQRTELAFAFPVRAVVEMGRFPHRSRLGLADPDGEVVSWAMERTGVGHLADRPVTETSGGERQRVLLARALAQVTPVLLLDEPTASLDVNHQVRTLSLARELVREEGRTVVAAIHDLNLAARFSDELVLLADGRVSASGPPASVLAEPTLESAFGTRVTVGRNPATGTPTVTALAGPPPTTRDGRVHVVGGGGHAGELLRQLVAAGYEVSAGVLAEDDPDAVVARSLDAQAVTVPPFTPVDAAVDHARELVRDADVTVLADVPVGPSNVGNLAVAEAASRLVVVESRPFPARNHAGEAAAERYAALRAVATVVEPAGAAEAVETALESARSVAADGGS